MIRIKKISKRLTLQVTLAALLDLIFFYVLTRLHLEVLVKVSEHMKVINQLLAEKASELTVTELGNLNNFLLSTPEFMTNYHAVMKLGTLFAVGGLITWILLQGTTWYLAQRMNGYKPIYWQYLGRFSVISVASTLVMFVLLFIITSLVESGAILPLFSENEPFIFSAISIAILAYFAFVLYARPNMDGLKRSITRLNPLLYVYLALLAAYAVAIILGTWLFTLHWAALIIFSFVFLLPSFSLARYLIVKLTN